MDIEFLAIQKRFGAFQALSDVSFAVRQGGIHALLGENGAGKTTLMRVLSGELRADGGTTIIDGKASTFSTPLDARRSGIRMVHQHLSLIPALTITENFLLDQDDAPLFPSFRVTSGSIRKEAERFGVSIDPDRQVWELSLSEQQWIEVFRALFLGGRIVILDEPTSLLSPIEGDRLLANLKMYAQAGRIVILITHKLREVKTFADTVTVLRRGRAIKTLPVKDTSPGELTSLMMGEKREGNGEETRHDARRVKPEPVLSLCKVSASDQRGKRLLSEIDLSLSRGWVCGVAGVAGNGQTELAGIVSGLLDPDQGKILPESRRSLVYRYVPADRTELGTGSGLSIAENLVLRTYQDREVSKHGILDWDRLSKCAETLAEDYKIKMRSPSDRIATLSGGNIQRVVLARELLDPADVLVVHNPTSGLDMATTAFARAKIREAALRGSAVLLISDDLDEILDLADEIVVLHGGRIAGSFARAEATIEEIGAVMAGMPSHKTVSQPVGCDPT